MDKLTGFNIHTIGRQVLIFLLLSRLTGRQVSRFLLFSWSTGFDIRFIFTVDRF